MRAVFFLVLLLLGAAPARAQELPDGQSEADFNAWLANDPAARARVMSFEGWAQVAGVSGVLPTWQILRTASMWRVCNDAPFEVPPPNLWPHLAATLRYIDRNVRPAVGPVEAVSGYRDPALNECAQGSPTSAHRDFIALDLIPLRPIERAALFRVLCRMHRASGPANEVGLGFYAYQRFHIDTRSFRRWGAVDTPDGASCMPPPPPPEPVVVPGQGQGPLTHPPPAEPPEPPELPR